jgi:hypothetical protein
MALRLVLRRLLTTIRDSHVFGNLRRVERIDSRPAIAVIEQHGHGFEFCVRLAVDGLRATLSDTIPTYHYERDNAELAERAQSSGHYGFLFHRKASPHSQTQTLRQFAKFYIDITTCKWYG